MRAKTFLNKFPYEELDSGDVIIVNDPHTVGCHVNDVSVIRPIYYEEEPVALSIVLAHWADVGGPMPGSFNPQATELYAEGLRIPLMKLYAKDKPVRSTWDIIKANIREFTVRTGDIIGQYMATRHTEARIHALMNKYGKEMTLAAMEQYISSVEKIFKSELKTLPDGEFEATDYGDMDIMAPNKPRIKVHLTMKKKGEHVTFDWRDSDPQPVSSWGTTRPSLLSATFASAAYTFPHLRPLNHGLIECIEVLSKPGTCVDVTEPSATTGYCSGAYEKETTCGLMCWAQCVAQVTPERVHAGNVNISNVCIGGLDPKTKRDYISYIWLEGGGGARTFKDGGDYYMFTFAAGARNQPVEIHERWYPFLYTKVSIMPDSCGHGKFRGGSGLCREIRVYADGILTIHGDRGKITPPGYNYGLNGGPNRLILYAQGDYEHPRELGQHATGIPTKKRDIVRIISNGGGGYGNPLKRDPYSVLDDVIDGYLTLKCAREVYGVSINEIDKKVLGYEIDWKKTKELREKLEKKARRIGLGFGCVHPEGKKISVDENKALERAKAAGLV